MLFCILIIFFQLILEFNGNMMGGVEVRLEGVGCGNKIGSSSHNN